MCYYAYTVHTSGLAIRPLERGGGRRQPACLGIRSLSHPRAAALSEEGSVLHIRRTKEKDRKRKGRKKKKNPQLQTLKENQSQKPKPKNCSQASAHEATRGLNEGLGALLHAVFGLVLILLLYLRPARCKAIWRFSRAVCAARIVDCTECM